MSGCLYELLVMPKTNTLNDDGSAIHPHQILLVQGLKTTLDHEKIICGVIQENSKRFCKAHGIECLHNEDSASACSACRFGCFSLRDYTDIQLVFKMSLKGNVEDIAETFAEAKLQHLLHCALPDHVPSCIGNYDTNCYFLRKKSTSTTWRAVKICLYIRQYTAKRSKSLRQSSQQQITDSNHEESAIVDVNDAKSNLENCLRELAITLNASDSDHRNSLAINYNDVDFSKGHNSIFSDSATKIEENEINRPPRWVFIDFGNNVSSVPAIHHQAKLI